MSKLQVMIDELESRCRVLDGNIQRDEAELQELLAKGRILSGALEAKKEQRSHFSHAINNIRAIDEVEETLPMMNESTEDPWGNAG